MVRIPVWAALLALSMVATWYGTYYLARNPLAQPVAFAFGGEALPADYARAMADGGLLAFPCLPGLGPVVARDDTRPVAAWIYGLVFLCHGRAALPPMGANTCDGAGLLGLALSGAPTMALFFGLGSALIHYLDHPQQATDVVRDRRITQDSVAIMFTTLLSVGLAWSLNLLTLEN
jgi:hypothetical protein